MAKKYVFCPVEITLDVIAGRWKVMIIYYLLEGKKRFNQLQGSFRVFRTGPCPSSSARWRGRE